MQEEKLADVLGPQFHFSPPGGTEAAAAWEHEQLVGLRQEYTDISKVDYNIGSTATPMSFAQISSVREGYEWYKRHYPLYPQEVLMCMARAQFGEEAVGERKRKPAASAPVSRPQAKPPPARFSVVHKPVELRFDGSKDIRGDDNKDDDTSPSDDSE